MLVMHASGLFAGSLGGAHSHLSGHGSNRSSVCLQAPRPFVIAMPAARVTASGARCRRYFHPSTLQHLPTALLGGRRDWRWQ